MDFNMKHVVWINVEMENSQFVSAMGDDWRFLVWSWSSFDNDVKIFVHVLWLIYVRRASPLSFDSFFEAF